jgi:hypothetical protein
MLNLFFSRLKAHSTSFLADACFIEKNHASLVEEQGHIHEYRPGGIYTIGEIVSHMVLTTINSEGHFESAYSYDNNEQWRLIEHIDVIVRTGDSKKNMPDPTVMRSNIFKDDGRIFDVPHVNWYCQSTGQLCHCQCI